MTIFYMKVSIFAYCSYPPDNPEEEDESNMANDQLIKLCNQDFFPTKNLHKRATSLLNYKEPKIPATKLRKLKERYRLNTCVPSSKAALHFMAILLIPIDRRHCSPCIFDSLIGPPTHLALFLIAFEI